MNFEEFRAKFYEFSNSEVGLITLIVTTFIVLLFTFISFISYKRQVKYKKRVKQIREIYDEIIKLPINQQLSIIEKIGKFNPKYAQIYTEKIKTYNNLKAVYIEPFSEELNGLDNILKTKKRKKLEKGLNNYYVKIQVLNEKVMSFYLRLKEVTKEDEEARTRAFKD